MLCLLILLITISVTVVAYMQRREHFVDSSGQVKFLNSLLTKPIIDPTEPVIVRDKNAYNEPLSDISQSMQLYVSVYSADSYSGYGKTWYNLAKQSSATQCTPQGEMATRDFTLTDASQFTKDHGMSVSKSQINGPMSWATGIKGSAEFTTFILCRHATSMSTKVNLFTLYGNTSSNIGLALNIKDVAQGPVNTGRLSVVFAGDVYDSKMIVPLDSDVLYMYVITKAATTITVQVASSVSQDMKEVLNANLKTPDVLFSNKAMCLNCNGYWNGYIKGIGMYNIALDKSRLSKVKDHMFLEEKKQDDVFATAQRRTTDLHTALNAIKACPYDQQTCNQCEITDWSKVDAILNAPLSCRSGIHKYCDVHPKDPACRCWDKNSDMYKASQCQNWRNVFTNEGTSCADGKLDKYALEKIKQRYNLVSKQSPQNHTNKAIDLKALTEQTAVIQKQLLDSVERRSNGANKKKHVTQPKDDKRTARGFINWLASRL